MSDSVKLLPLTEPEKPAVAPTFRISISRFLFVGFSLLPFCLTWCIVETILTDYWSSTYTHCGVLNVLPSLSSAARHNELVWRMVTLESLVYRVIVAWLYARFYRHIVPRHFPQLGAICLLLFLLEGISTIVMALSMQSSGEGPLHVLTVISIWCCQTGYMTAFNYCYASYPSYALEPHQLQSYRLKRRLVRLILVSSVGMIIFYLLHNKYCLPLGELGERESFVSLIACLQPTPSSRVSSTSSTIRSCATFGARIWTSTGYTCAGMPRRDSPYRT